MLLFQHNLQSAGVAPAESFFVVAGRMAQRKRWDDEAKKKKQDEDDEDKRKEALLAETIAVPVPNKPRLRNITIAQLIGKTAAAEMSYFDIELCVQAIKRQKRQQDEDEFLMMS